MRHPQGWWRALISRSSANPAAVDSLSIWEEIHTPILPAVLITFHFPIWRSWGGNKIISKILVNTSKTRLINPCFSLNRHVNSPLFLILFYLNFIFNFYFTPFFSSMTFLKSPKQIYYLSKESEQFQTFVRNFELINLINSSSSPSDEILIDFCHYLTKTTM